MEELQKELELYILNILKDYENSKDVSFSLGLNGGFDIVKESANIGTIYVSKRNGEGFGSLLINGHRLQFNYYQEEFDNYVRKVVENFEKEVLEDKIKQVKSYLTK